MQDPIRKQRLQSLFEILSEQLQYQHDGDLPHENFSPGDRYCTLESSQEGSCFWANSFKNLDEAATHITTLAFDGYWGVDAVIDLDQMELIEGSIHVKLAHKRHPSVPGRRDWSEPTSRREPTARLAQATPRSLESLECLN